MTHACYLLRSLNHRFRAQFYIGCTTDPRRRLRQHNGELGQGAHFTKAKRPWEMLLCIYGFPTHVSALQFEWAWQHPLTSKAVRDAASNLQNLKGIPGRIVLVCTMVTLPKWNSLSLSLQFLLSDLLRHKVGSPPLPPQMRLFVAPMNSLPGKGCQDDCDDLSSCVDMLVHNEQFRNDSSISIMPVQPIIFECNVSSSEIESNRQGKRKTPLGSNKIREDSPELSKEENSKRSLKRKEPGWKNDKTGRTQKLSKFSIMNSSQKWENNTSKLLEPDKDDQVDQTQNNDHYVCCGSTMTLSDVAAGCEDNPSKRDMMVSEDLNKGIEDKCLSYHVLEEDFQRSSCEGNYLISFTSNFTQEKTAGSNDLLQENSSFLVEQLKTPKTVSKNCQELDLSIGASNVAVLRNSMVFRTVKEAHHLCSDSDVEEIPLEEFQLVGTHRETHMETMVHNKDELVRGSPRSAMFSKRDQVRADKRIPAESLKAVNNHQSSLSEFFKVTKQAVLPKSPDRNLRMDDRGSVLRGHYDVPTSHIKVGREEKHQHDLRSWIQEKNQCIVLTSDSDDDNEIQEIGETEFLHQPSN